MARHNSQMQQQQQSLDTPQLTLQPRSILSLDEALAYSDDSAAISALIATQSWNSMAEFARRRITTMSENKDEALVLDFWMFRVVALFKLKLFERASAELEAVFRHLPAITSTTVEYDDLIPFELYVMRATVCALVTDRQTMRAVQNMFSLIEFSKRIQTHEGNDEWHERELHLKLHTVNFLLELKDYGVATSVLESCLLAITASSASITIVMFLARVSIMVGNRPAAARHFKRIADMMQSGSSTEGGHDLLMMNRAAVSVCEGDWVAASTILTTLVSASPQNIAAINNLCVCLLYLGRLQEVKTKCHEHLYICRQYPCWRQ